MNNYLSDKLKMISFISIIMVVFIHSLNLTVNFNSGNMELKNSYNLFIQEYISQGIATIAVPFFFCISGYLFFLKLNGTRKEFTLKFIKRSKSLVIPYVLWSFWGLSFYFILQLFPQSQNFFTKKLIINYSFSELVNSLFINPIPYQLWFLRDLILLILVSPLIYFLIKYFRLPTILILFVLWLGFFDFTFYIFKNESLLFFSLGAYLTYNQKILLDKLNKKRYWIVLYLWFLIFFIKTALVTFNFDYNILILLLGKIGILIGIFSVWSAYDLWMKDKEHPNKLLYNLSIYSFFIFVFHEPVLTFIKKGMFFLTGTSEIMFLINYFISPLIVISLSVLVAAFLIKKTPSLYKFITGGR